jgi:hypothetical protein
LEILPDTFIMGDNVSKERRNTLAFCLEGEEEEEEITSCECGYANGHPPRNALDLRDLTASSLDSGRLERTNAMDLDPPYLVQKRVMVEILFSAYNNLCNRVTVPFSEEPLFAKLELLITTQRMELLSLETSTLRPLTPSLQKLKIWSSQPTLGVWHCLAIFFPWKFERKCIEENPILSLL